MFPSDDLDAVRAWDAYMKQGDPTHHCPNCRAHGHSSSCELCGAATTRIPEPLDMDGIKGDTIYTLELDLENRTATYNLPDDEDS